MVITSLILMGSFAVMGVSDFMPTAQFGILSSLTVALALLADLALNPCILAWQRRPALSAASRTMPAPIDAGGVV